MTTRDCICDRLDWEILKWIQNQTLPSEALVRTCCWRRICQVRGGNLGLVDPEVWRDICRERGYLYARQNPRGF